MILLDSNALIWLLAGDGRLGPAARSRIGESRPAFSSAVSVLELTMKEMLGRLSLVEPLSTATGRAGLAELPFTAAHAEQLRALPDLVRHDPFDRMLLAQARVEGMPLLTSDRFLLSAAGELTLDARE